MNKVLTAASVLLLVGAIPVSSAADPSTSRAPMAPEMSRGGAISACDTFITEPGRYDVTQDLYCEPDQQGIWVLSSKVTVDLNGHTIFCDAANSVVSVAGVFVGDFFDPELVLEKVRVQNGTVSGCVDGVIYFFTESGTITNITTTDNFSGGITLIETRNTTVKKNVMRRNFEGIQSFGGTNNKFTHNWSTGNFDASLLIDDGETGSRLLCNTSEQDGAGIAVGPFSTANIIRGNYINNPFALGITMYGLLFPDFLIDVPSGNTIVNNIAQGSGIADLSEITVDLSTGGIFVADDAQCQNTWEKNQYVTWLGPDDCVAPPVLLDDDDVCALDDDEDDDNGDDD